MNSQAQTTRHFDPPRALSPEEKRLLDFLLNKSFDGRDVLVQQAATARVVAECTCGCRSIDLIVDSLSTPPVVLPSPLSTELLADDEEGNPVMVMVFLNDEGYMCLLEITRYDGEPIRGDSLKNVRHFSWNDAR